MIPGVRLSFVPGRVAYVTEVERNVFVVEVMRFLTPAQAKRGVGG